LMPMGRHPPASYVHYKVTIENIRGFEIQILLLLTWKISFSFLVV